MCIRDREIRKSTEPKVWMKKGGYIVIEQTEALVSIDVNTCLLYTSDAADERSSVDLGGRRIIKKKNQSINIEIW